MISTSLPPLSYFESNGDFWWQMGWHLMVFCVVIWFKLEVYLKRIFFNVCKNFCTWIDIASVVDMCKTKTGNYSNWTPDTHLFEYLILVVRWLAFNDHYQEEFSITRCTIFKWKASFANFYFPTHLNIGYPYISYTSTRFSEKLQW